MPATTPILNDHKICQLGGLLCLLSRLSQKSLAIPSIPCISPLGDCRFRELVKAKVKAITSETPLSHFLQSPNGAFELKSYASATIRQLALGDIRDSNPQAENLPQISVVGCLWQSCRTFRGPRRPLPRPMFQFPVKTPFRLAMDALHGNRRDTRPRCICPCQPRKKI